MVAVVLLRVVIVVLISSPVFYKVESKVKGLTQDQKLLISNLRSVCFINQSQSICHIEENIAFLEGAVWLAASLAGNILVQIPQI